MNSVNVDHWERCASAQSRSEGAFACSRLAHDHDAFHGFVWPQEKQLTGLLH
jgi:hypothetical protein